MYYLNIKTLDTSIFSDTVELGENYFMNNSKDTEQRVVDFLDNLAIDYELIRIDPSYADTAQFCEAYKYPLAKSANAILIASKRGPKSYSICLALANTRIDVNKTVRKLMGVKRVSFATPDEMNSLTGMQVGGVTPFALPENLPVYVDSRIMELDWIIVGTGGRASKLKLSPKILHNISNLQVVDGLAFNLDS